MNGHGDHDPYDDWTDRFDDMDGTDWSDHYSLFNPDPEQREIADLNAYLESQREADDDLAWAMDIGGHGEAIADSEREAREREYGGTKAPGLRFDPERIDPL